MNDHHLIPAKKVVSEIDSESLILRRFTRHRSFFYRRMLLEDRRTIHVSHITPKHMLCGFNHGKRHRANARRINIISSKKELVNDIIKRSPRKNTSRKMENVFIVSVPSRKSAHLPLPRAVRMGKARQVGLLEHRETGKLTPVTTQLRFLYTR